MRRQTWPRRCRRPRSSPTAAISTPARAGPATNASCWIVVCRAMAAVTSGASTSMGSAARRVGQSTPWKPAPAAVQTNRGHTAGCGIDALTTRPPTARCHGELGEHQDPLAIHGVSQGAAPQGAGQQGYQLDDADQADDECRTGQGVGLKGNRHQRQLRAQPRDHLAHPDPAEVPVLPQRGDVDDEAGHLCTVTARGGGAAPRLCSGELYAALPGATAMHLISTSASARKSSVTPTSVHAG